MKSTPGKVRTRSVATSHCTIHRRLWPRNPPTGRTGHSLKHVAEHLLHFPQSPSRHAKGEIDICFLHTEGR